MVKLRCQTRHPIQSVGHFPPVSLWPGITDTKPRGTAGGIGRRMKDVRFEKTFAPEYRDAQLLTTLADSLVSDSALPDSDTLVGAVAHH
jgi:hypothetical protein